MSSTETVQTLLKKAGLTEKMISPERTTKINEKLTFGIEFEFVLKALKNRQRTNTQTMVAKYMALTI